MFKNLMLVPSLSCPASCKYCFGPHRGGGCMQREILEAVVNWLNQLGSDPLDITFHGGEPLVPGAAFYRMALPLLRDGLAPRKIRIGIQSNLWLLTEEQCELFLKHGVSVGTSIDGPEPINNAQRGKGYFRRTMAGIELAEAHGLSVGGICTFTSKSAPLAPEIFDFFLNRGLNFSIHAALPSLHHLRPDNQALGPEAHGELLVGILERYLDNLSRIRIGTLDSMCRSLSAGRGSICTFTDCLGDYLAIGPDGAVYPCQRFAGMADYRLGNVNDTPGLEELSAAPAWRAFEERQQRIGETCGECSHLQLCRGGCPYNVLAAHGSKSHLIHRDPHCASYRRVFDHIENRAMEEVFSEENLEAVIHSTTARGGLLQRGKLLAIMGDGPHPYEAARHARKILAAALLAATISPAEATLKFRQLGLARDSKNTMEGMQRLHDTLTKPTTGLNNLYLHITFACGLRCTHCYARAGVQDRGVFSVEDAVRTCREASRLGFRHLVITGGEPLEHPRRDTLLDALAGLRTRVKPLLTVLRTSLAMPMDDSLLRRIGHGTDEVVVSLDGDRETHDARRGAGSYDHTVHNLRALVERGYDTKLSLATVLPLHQTNGPPGESVRSLARELGIGRTRFRPLLPLGRALKAEPDIVPETLWGHMDPRDAVGYGFTPTASCGMGQNLYVEPDGAAYPCYAWHGEAWRLGTINGSDGLSGVIASEAFRQLGRHTVDSNRRCRRCPLRYLCGGACRAWNRQAVEEQADLDAPPVDCTALHRRARSLLVSALEELNITPEAWRAAGLPLPDTPPE